jgi:hypothetical protein
MELKDWMAQNEPPEVLYHYTSAEGLSGILKQRQVWATVSTYLNDSREYLHAVRIIRDLIIDRLKSTQTDNLAADFCASLENRLSHNDGRQICVFSLSERGDLLSQWRGYCPMSGGYSLGFSAEQLRPHLERQRFLLARCIYERETQRELVEPLLDRAISEFRGLPTAESRQIRLNGVIEGFFVRNFSRIAPLLKDDSFAEENEWRAVSELVSHRGLKYRIKGSLPIPYCPLDVCGHEGFWPLREIIVGPMSNQPLAEDGVKVMLHDHGVVGDFPRVKPSRIPYRTV